jgi:hypothetical protein
MKAFLAFLVGLAVIVAGCSSSPKPRLSKSEIQQINWSERIGSYTYAEALTDLGKPAVISESHQGRTAEWILRRSPQMSFGFGVGGGSYGGGVGTGVGVGTGYTPPPRGEYLRLHFGPDEKLAEWSKVKY